MRYYSPWLVYGGSIAGYSIILAICARGYQHLKPSTIYLNECFIPRSHFQNLNDGFVQRLTIRMWMLLKSWPQQSHSLPWLRSSPGLSWSSVVLSSTIFPLQAASPIAGTEKAFSDPLSSVTAWKLSISKLHAAETQTSPLHSAASPLSSLTFDCRLTGNLGEELNGIDVLWGLIMRRMTLDTIGLH